MFNHYVNVQEVKSETTPHGLHHIGTRTLTNARTTIRTNVKYVSQGPRITKPCHRTKPGAGIRTSLSRSAIVTIHLVSALQRFHQFTPP